MKDRLPRCLVHINTHIVSVRMESLVHLLLHVLKHHIHGLPFMISQVEVRSHMPLGDNQCMTWRYRITVIEHHTSSRLTNNFHSSRQTAERTNLPFLPGQLIEMLILIKFIARITFQTLERQPHITLIGVLAMNGMQPEPFFRQVTTHGKKGRSRRSKKVRDIHHHFRLCVWFQYIQHIVAQNGIKLPVRIFRTIIIVVPRDVIPLTFQLVCIKAIPAAKVQNTSLQQIMLKQVTGGYRKTRTLDGGEVYLYAIIVQIIFNLEILFSLIFED